MDTQKLTITPEMLRTVAQIDEFKGRWQALSNLPSARLTLIRQAAKLESILASAFLEGSELNQHAAKQLIEQDEGYAAAITFLFDNYPQLAISEITIKELHQRISTDPNTAGHYKTTPNKIETVAVTSQHQGAPVNTATPEETAKRVATLVKQTQVQLKNPKTHPLLVIGIFIIEFLLIHPFENHNRELARLLTKFLLLKCGYEHIMYSARENIIASYQDQYYLAQRRALAAYDNDPQRLTRWLTFFLMALQKQCADLQARIEKEHKLSRNKTTDIDKQILQLAHERGSLVISDITALLNVNRNTLKVRLRELVKKGLLKHNGTGKGSFYSSI